MRAILRLRTVLFAGGLWLVTAEAFAQNTTEPVTLNAPVPAPDTIGPRELQNFKLPGTTTRPDTTPAPVVAPPTTRSSDRETQASPATEAAPTRRAAPVRVPTRVAAPPRAPTVSTQPQQSEPALLPSAAPPEPGSEVAAPPAAAIAASPLTDESRPSILPWLLAAAALAAGAILLFWWRRSRPVLADGPEVEYFAAPEPVPTREPPLLPPPPLPPPPVVAERKAPAANGLVAARLRPALEIGVHPLRCLVDDNSVTIEFEVELFNAGTAPARAVLAEASLLNASATQDNELANFFAHPMGAGDRLDVIPPMKRISLTSRVVAPRGAVQEYELAGRKSFVPVLAFNAHYEWSGGKGQTSAAYLVGRETRGDKLGPLRLDQGAREYRGLDARTLPSSLRT